MGGAALPYYIEAITSRLGDAFSPVIFVLTGAASVGTFSALTSYILVRPTVLVLLKCVVLPALLTLSPMVSARAPMRDFAFVVGLPAGGSSMVICTDAGISEFQQMVLMATLSLGKLVSLRCSYCDAHALDELGDVTRLLLRLDTFLQVASLTFCMLLLLLWVVKAPHSLAWVGKRGDSLLVVIQTLLLISHLILGKSCTRWGFCVSEAFGQRRPGTHSPMCCTARRRHYCA